MAPLPPITGEADKVTTRSEGKGKRPSSNGRRKEKKKGAPSSVVMVLCVFVFLCVFMCE